MVRYIRRPESTMGWVIAAVVLVIVLAGGGVGIWLIVRASKKKKITRASKAKKASRRRSSPPLAAVSPPVDAPVVYAPMSTPDPVNAFLSRPQTSSQLGFEEAVARSLATAPTTTLANWKNKVPLVLTTQQIENKQVQTAKHEAARAAAIAVLSAKLQERKLAKPLEAGKNNKVPTAAETAKKERDAKNAAAWAAVGAKLKAKNKVPTAAETAKKARDAKNAAAWAAVGAKLKAKKGAAATATTGTGTGAWMRASATWYTSHPKCCKGASNYDPKADKKECDEYSGCKWAGQFAGVDKQLSIAEVAKRDIVAFYDAKNQKGNKKAAEAWWNKNVKGKKIELKKPDGTTMIVEALDTCSDSDTQGGECTKNANKNNGGGILIDLEESTAKRFYPGGKIKDNSSIEWRWAK